MPLNTQILRDGKPLTVNWGGFHAVAMTLAAVYDSGQGPFEDNSEPAYTTQDKEGKELPPGHYITPTDLWRLMSYEVIAMTPLNNGPYTLKRPYIFIDAQDGEVLVLRPGDELSAYRSHK